MEQQHIHTPDLSRAGASIDTLRERLLDTATYLRGLAAIVESMNKGAVDGMEIAIHAIEAVAEDLHEVRAIIPEPKSVTDYNAARSPPI